MEQKCAKKILTLKNDYNFDEEILELARSIRGIDYVQNVGDLSVLYKKWCEENHERVPSGVKQQLSC